jgi:hypothetical protein
MENINLNAEIEKDASSDEESELDLIQTDAVELNDFDSKENDHFLIGIYGNGSGYLKSTLYLEMKSNNKSFKVKFMAKAAKDNTRAKKVCAEVYQFNQNNVNNIVLHTKQNLTDQSYKYIFDYLTNKAGLTYKRVAVFDSVHSSDFFGEPGIYCVKNSKQMMSNQLIRVKNLPPPNTIQGFSAYVLTFHEVIALPAVSYLSVSTLYEVCLESLGQFNETVVSYAFLRDKLSESYLTSKGITNSSIQLLLKEFNAFKNQVYI